MRYVIIRKDSVPAPIDDQARIRAIDGVQHLETRERLILAEFTGTAGELRARLGELPGQWLVSELRTYRLA
ncbi:hypothetical protein DIE18_03145 [Burkholderia sp. Bp9125]|nr:hypothetical protein DIE18_03145 [Burkholderia sp. Bp9125]